MLSDFTVDWLQVSNEMYLLQVSNEMYFLFAVNFWRNTKITTDVNV